MWSLVFYSVLLTFVLAAEHESRVVQTTQGPVRGYKNQEDNIFEFHSIPYATVPTGLNRFKAPLLAPKWIETLDATEKEIVCPQRDIMGILSKSVKMQEDCLIANIYVPNKQEQNLPVVVYVHGGAYLGGYGNLFTPRKLAGTKNILVVTFNYRLAAHGFLCLGTDDIPGNAGMKDQVALLRWVKKNIASFGGNPDDVTIAGYSAGSSSVDLLMISKMARGLFKRVIPESGANTAAFSVQPEPLRNAKEYAQLLGFDKVDDLYALESFFKSISIEKLNSVDLFDRRDGMYLMSPCVERVTKEERFLDDNPVNILKTGDYHKLPMLYGFANMEGLLHVQNFESWKNEMNENFSNFLPGDLQFKSDKEKEDVANKIKQFYFGDERVSPNNILAYIDYFTDVIFAYPTLRSAKLQVESGNSNIFLYEYSYVDDNTPFVPYTNVRGASHCAQTSAVLETIEIPGMPPAILSEKFLKMTEIMRTIWHSFITTGNPIPPKSDLPKWPPVGANWTPHMSLNQSIELRGSLLKKRTEFWDEIYDKYYLVPTAPPQPPPKHSEL